MTASSIHDQIALVTSTAPGQRLPARSWRRDEAMRLDLGGTWRFRLSPGPRQAPADAADRDVDDSGWDELQVPGHWALQGHGAPIYTNVQFPVPLDPPFVPDENPTADHRTWFEVPADWTADRLVLRFDGIESHALVHLNGRYVGRTTGSRLPTEFDVTDLLVPGRNLLHVRVNQWSANTFLEDQDQWWLAGIFRDVSLVGRHGAGIDDHWLRAEYDAATGRGRIVPWLRCSEQAFPVRLVVAQLDVDVTWQSADEVLPVEVGQVAAWTPETPVLIEARLENAVDHVTERLGFRSIEIRDRTWLVNGVPLRLRGVNRHDFHPVLGRVFDPEDARANLLTMKRHHVNAIRTSHYPPHPELLDMCDELGFWVIDECDLETHGFELAGWVGNPSGDPAWRENYLDRADRMVERDKNHPSVICWSLGNESGTGANLAAMAAQIRRRDPERPIHYEGDHEGAYTDVVSQMYTPLVAMREMSACRGTALTARPAQMARLASMPMMLCEYAHAMGNGPGGLAEYDEAFDLPGWHGGFVWEWRDHGLQRVLPDGTVTHGYGGDFGEVVHDGSFVCDGLVLPDGTPTAGLVELAAVNAPLLLRVDGGDLVVDNRFCALDTSVADLHWARLVEGRMVEQGRLELPEPVPARGLGRVALPDVVADGHDQHLVVWALANDSYRAHQPWLADAELELGRVEVALTPRRAFPSAQPTASPVVDGDTIRVGTAVLDRHTGSLVQLGEVPVGACHVELWRAPTENDSLDTFGSYELADPELTGGFGAPGLPSAARWRQAGLDRLMTRLVSLDARDDEVVVVQRLLPAQASTGAEVEWHWSADRDGVRVHVDVTPVAGPGDATCTWPRVGVHLALPKDLDRADWYGMGPGQSYPDSDRAAHLGLWSSPTKELADALVVPQEAGHRAGVRWVEFGAAAGGIRVENVGRTDLGFVAGPHDVHEQTAAAHRHELPPSTATHVYLDAVQHGLGTRSCGPDVLPVHQSWPAAHSLDLVLRTTGN